jgi:hypothetical protein
VADNSFTGVAYPHDPAYKLRRGKMIDSLLQMSPQQLDRQLSYMMKQPAPRDDSGEITRRVMGELYTAPYIPPQIKGILDSSSGTTGNVLIRQDLEPTLYALVA